MQMVQEHILNLYEGITSKLTEEEIENINSKGIIEEQKENVGLEELLNESVEKREDSLAKKKFIEEKREEEIKEFKEYLKTVLNGGKISNIYDIKNKVIELIKEVDLYKYRNSKVSHLSGGQKQRVAIARALAKDVPIIIADEPTGNLDRRSAASIMKLLAKVAKDKLVIVVTHNYEDVEDLATRKIEMHDGKVREDITIKPYEESKVSLHEYKNISFLNKITYEVYFTFNGILINYFCLFRNIFFV